MRTHLFFVALLFLSVTRGFAQERLTEDVFLAPFGEDHIAVQALTEDLARAEAARRRATTLGNPRVEYGLENPEGGPKQTTWSAAWTPPLDGRLSVARDAAEAGLAAARQRFAADRLRLRREIRKAYAEWALGAERRDVLASQREFVETLAAQASRRAEAGEESGIAARRLRLAAADIATELAVAESEAIRAEALARAWRPEIAPGPRPARPPLRPPPDASGTRPELEALRLEVRQAELEGKLARRFVLFPELQAGWQRLEERGADRTGPVFGVSWSLPLFDRFQADRTEAAGRQRALESRLALASARLRSEREAASASYGRLAERAREQERAISETSKLVEGATASFRAGESGVTDLLETLRSIREARLREIALYAEALEAQRALEAASAPHSSEGERR